MGTHLSFPRRKEMTKSRILAILSVFILVYSQLSAGADPTVELIWTEKNGNPLSAGSSSIRAKAGDELTLDIEVTDNDAIGICFAGLSLNWNDTILTGFDAEECPSPPNASAGTCRDSLGVTYIINTPGVVHTAGHAGVFGPVLAGSGACLFSGPVGFISETMTMGRTKFLVQSQATSNIVVVYDDPNGHFILTGSGTGESDYPDATATVLPPVGC
jgi:hypothetical protein